MTNLDTQLRRRTRSNQPRVIKDGERYNDELCFLRVAEQAFVPFATHKERTVVITGVQTQGEFDAKVRPLLATLALTPTGWGLTYSGVGVTFETKAEAAMFRLFYEGDTQ